MDLINYPQVSFWTKSSGKFFGPLQKMAKFFDLKHLKSAFFPAWKSCLRGPFSSPGIVSFLRSKSLTVMRGTATMTFSASQFISYRTLSADYSTSTSGNGGRNRSAGALYHSLTGPLSSFVAVTWGGCCVICFRQFKFTFLKDSWLAISMLVNASLWVVVDLSRLVFQWRLSRSYWSSRSLSSRIFYLLPDVLDISREHAFLRW